MGIAIATTARLLQLVPRVACSRWVGAWARATLPTPLGRLVVDGYCSLFAVDLAEADPDEQPYPNLDALFTRRLRPGVRPIATDPMVSPADGVLAAAGKITRGSLTIKGSEYTVAELTGDGGDAARYRDGAYAVVYLSPRDYHRVHAPVDGRALTVTGIPGDLFPVNAVGERIEKVFSRNSRVAIRVETRDLGEVTVVMVGALNVGRMGIDVLGGVEATPGRASLQPPRPLSRGDEMGTFHLGSSVVLLSERPLALRAPGGPVKYGESLLVAP